MDDPRPVFSKELGDFFRALREKRGLGLRQAVTLAENRKLKAITLNRLGRLERGGTKNPAPDLLRDIAKLYGADYDVLEARVVEYRRSLTPSIRPTDGQTGQSAGRSELHSSAQSGVNSQGTNRAKRPASLQGAPYAEPVETAPHAAAIAAHLGQIITTLQDIIHELLPLPDQDEAQTDSDEPTESSPRVRVATGSLARTKRKHRKAS